MKWLDEKWLDGIIIGLIITAYGIVWCFDKVRALIGKESILDRWTNTW